MSSSVPIPDTKDDALGSAVRRLYSLLQEIGNRASAARDDLVNLSHWFEYIDRAARIDELKREIDSHRLRADQVTVTRDGTLLRLHHLDEVARLRNRIAELEHQDG